MMLEASSWPIPVKKYNVDLAPVEAEKHQIRGTPTFCLMENNREIRRVVGAVSHNQLHEFIKGGI